LQNDLERIANFVGAELGKGFGAVATLKQESLALGNPPQLQLQILDFSGEHQRRQRLQTLFRVGQAGRVGVHRLLPDRKITPAGDGILAVGRGIHRIA